MEGAIIEKGAIVEPNSVVPPGRVVPAMQLWGGNPIKYIRNVQDP
jgi:carbonic anhydrase/acetyltransferase-like protein (isoleucine patch superfamily)